MTIKAVVPPYWISLNFTFWRYDWVFFRQFFITSTIYFSLISLLNSSSYDFMQSILIIKFLTFEIQTACFCDVLTVISVPVKNTKVLEYTCDSINENIILVFQSLKISKSFFCCREVFHLVDFKCMWMFLKKCLD